MKHLNTNPHIEFFTSARTLRELLEVVDKPAGKLPTMKEMRSRTDRLYTYSDENSELVVYQCGFFTYSVGGRHTVQRIDSCLKPVQYKTVMDSNLSIPVEALLDEPFQIRLTLEGEARIAANREGSEQKRTFRMDTLDYGKRRPERSRKRLRCPDACGGRRAGHAPEASARVRHAD